MNHYLIKKPKRIFLYIKLFLVLAYFGIVNAESIGSTLNKSVTVTGTGQPKVILMNPSNGSNNVYYGTLISVTYNKEVDPSSVNSKTFTVSIHSSNSAIGGKIESNVDNLTFTFKPDNELTFETAYDVRLNGVKSLDGLEGGEAEDYSGIFTVESYPFSHPFGLAVNSSGTYAYIANNSSKNISICSIENEFLKSCKNTNLYHGADPTTELIDIALNSGDTIAYVTSPLGAVISCDVSKDLLSSCKTAYISEMMYPGGIALNSSGTTAFITDFFSTYNTVSGCTVSGKSITGCVSNTGMDTFNTPDDVAVNSSDTFGFILNSKSQNVSGCTINGKTLSNCQIVASGFNDPHSIMLNHNDTFAYVTNTGDNTVTLCKVAHDTLTECTNSGANNLNGPYGIALNKGGNIAFITNSANSTITSCFVGDDGSLSNCKKAY